MTYNGWTNRPTWATNLWLTNEPDSYDELTRLANSPGPRSYRAAALKDYVMERFALPTTGLASDLMQIDSVDFEEILDGAIEEI